jgi:hypothetical protein
MEMERRVGEQGTPKAAGKAKFKVGALLPKLRGLLPGNS